VINRKEPRVFSGRGDDRVPKEKTEESRWHLEKVGENDRVAVKGIVFLAFLADEWLSLGKAADGEEKTLPREGPKDLETCL